MVPFTVLPRGHELYSGEPNINLVGARSCGILMSPREEEPFSFGNHHVELLSISGTVDNNESTACHDNIKKNQQSFGLVYVPLWNIYI